MIALQAVDQLHNALVSVLEQHDKSETAPEARHLIALAQRIIRSGAVSLPEEQRDEVIQAVVDRILSWGPLTRFLNDPTVTELMVNGSRSLYIERQGKLERVQDFQIGEEELMQIMNRMVSLVGRRIDPASPLVDARLPDGSRVNAIIPPLSLIGPVLTIRRFPARPMVMHDLVSGGALSRGMAAFLQAAVLAKQNIVISGGTGSGKTTTLNAIASGIPEIERIITIEDAAEMRLTHPHLVSLEARPPNLEGKGEIPVRLLLKNALRMRPDRIIVGEIRGGEALDMLQAMNTGHQGSLTTVHANAPLEALLRIETMTLMADVDLPLSAIRQQLTQAIHLVIQQERLRDGRRVIVAIDEVGRTGDGQYQLFPIFQYDKNKGSFEGIGGLPRSASAYRHQGVVLEDSWFQ